MRTVFDETAHSDLVRRFGQLQPDSQRRWGTMSVGQMLVHLCDQLAVTLGEIPSPPPGGPLRFFPVNAFVIRWMPWPHGRTPTHPVFLTSEPAEFAADNERVVELLERVSRTGPEGAYPLHPLFGRLSGRLWGELAYRHTDYHLRQFGA